MAMAMTEVTVTALPSVAHAGPEYAQGMAAETSDCATQIV